MHNVTWPATMASLMLSMRTDSTDVFNENMYKARSLIAACMAAVTMPNDSYDTAYQHIIKYIHLYLYCAYYINYYYILILCIRLHMLYDMEQMYNVVRSLNVAVVVNTHGHEYDVDDIPTQLTTANNIIAKRLQFVQVYIIFMLFY